jgi:hypothetical protein
MASGKLRALLAQAMLGARTDLVPGSEVIGQPIDFGTVARI